MKFTWIQWSLPLFYYSQFHEFSVNLMTYCIALPFLAQSQFHEFSVNSTFFLYSSHTLWWSEKFAITRTQCGDFGNFPSLQKFSSNWFTVKFFSEKVNLTEFLQNIVGDKFANFHTVGSKLLDFSHKNSVKLTFY